MVVIFAKLQSLVLFLSSWGYYLLKPSLLFDVGDLFLLYFAIPKDSYMTQQTINPMDHKYIAR